jgi:phosphatidylglycerophosphate synthase
VDGLRSLGFDVREAADPAAAATELSRAPAGERVALVDPRFVGHVHSLRLALTDPRFTAAAVPGAVTVRDPARPALVRALAGLAGDGPTGPAPSGAADVGSDAAGRALASRGGNGTAPRGRTGMPGAAERGTGASEQTAGKRDGSATAPDGQGDGRKVRRATAGPSGSRRGPGGAVAVADQTPAASERGIGASEPDALVDERAGDAATVTGADTVGRLGSAAALPDAVASALDGEGVTVQRPELGVLVAAVPADAEERRAAEDAVARVDEEAVRLRGAVKPRDGFFTTFAVSPYSRYLARWCARRGLTPNQVTTASLLTALVAAACAATGTRTGFVAAGALLLGSFVLDCTDGQLARYSLQYSTLGAWLDATFDRAKEYAYYAGLALGAARGGDDVWALALAAMVLQTVRHMVDFSFNEADHDDATDRGSAAALSGRLDDVGWTVWVRRIIVLPIGERWALIAVLTACTTPRITLVVLLTGCALAACYTTAGRVLRSVTRTARRTERSGRALAELADTGPLAGAVARAGRGAPGVPSPVLAALGAAGMVAVALWTPAGSWWPVVAAAGYAVVSGAAVAGRLRGPLDWLVPPVLRTAEYVTVLVLAARSEVDGALPAAFGLVSAVAYHHYDTVYRIRGGTGAPPAWLVRATGGHEGRTLAVTIAAALLLGGPGSGFTLALTAFAVVIAAAVLVESIRFWASSGAPAVHDESGEPA